MSNKYLTITGKRADVQLSDGRYVGGQTTAGSLFCQLYVCMYVGRVMGGATFSEYGNIFQFSVTLGHVFCYVLLSRARFSPTMLVKQFTAEGGGLIQSVLLLLRTVVQY